MFICKKCLGKYEGPAVEMAEAIGPQSVGPCEVCDRNKVCYDIPSSANFDLKQKPSK